MKRACALLVLAGAAAFGQSSPDNSATESLRNRVHRLKLLEAPKDGAPKSVLVAEAPSSVCAIPLLNVLPPGQKEISKMPVLKPQGGAEPGRREPGVMVPMPACDEKLFGNK